MTFDELKAEALRQGYKLVAIEPRPLKIREAFPNYGSPWTTEDLDAVGLAFLYGSSLYTISDLLGRTPLSIAKKLVAKRLLKFDKKSQSFFNMKGKFVAQPKALEAFVNNRMKV